MSDNNRFLHEYTYRVWRRFRLALIIYNALWLVVLFMGWLIMKQLRLKIWYSTDLIYPVLHFVYQLRVPLALLALTGGNILILVFHLQRRLRELDWVLNAAEQMTTDSSQAIHFPPQGRELEFLLNELRRKLQDSQRIAQEAEQRKNDLVVYLAHDLKTPLTSVIGYLSLLQEEPQISETTRGHYIQVALDKAERLEDLVNEFFEITRFNLTHITLEKSRISLTRMLQQLIFEFQPMLAERGLSCQLCGGTDPGAARRPDADNKSNAADRRDADSKFDTALSAVHTETIKDIQYVCDGDKIQRVFDNLLKNAVNYSYPNTEILIFLTQIGEECCVDFYNHGADIPPEKLDRIFEQFFRLDSARRTSNGGAGVGLAIAKEIVELHGGTLTAESGGERIGFHVRFPIHGA